MENAKLEMRCTRIQAVANDTRRSRQSCSLANAHSEDCIVVLYTCSNTVRVAFSFNRARSISQTRAKPPIAESI